MEPIWRSQVSGDDKYESGWTDGWIRRAPIFLLEVDESLRNQSPQSPCQFAREVQAKRIEANKRTKYIKLYG